MTRHPMGYPRGADDIRWHLERKGKERRDPAAQASGSQGEDPPVRGGSGGPGRRRKGRPRVEVMGARRHTPGGRGQREVTALTPGGPRRTAISATGAFGAGNAALFLYTGL